MNKIEGLLKKIRKVLILGGLILIVLGGYFFYVYQSSKSYLETDGKIYKAEIVKEAHTDNKGNVIESTYNIYIRYEVSGKKYEAVLKKVSGFKEGDRINISYNPNNPGQIAQPMSIFLPIGLIIGGLVSLIVGIRMKKSSKEKKPAVKQEVMMVNGNQ